EPVERPAHRLDDPVLRRHERTGPQLPAQRFQRVIEECARREERRHALRDIERLERVLVVLAAELDAHVLRARRKAVARDVLEHVEHALIARVVGVGPEILARARRAAQRRREPTEEVLRLEHSELLTAFREREAGGESADAAADDDRMSQRETSMGMTRGFEVTRLPRSQSRRSASRRHGRTAARLDSRTAWAQASAPRRVTRSSRARRRASGEARRSVSRASATTWARSSVLSSRWRSSISSTSRC